MNKRAFIIVCDSLGVGYEPDAYKYIGHDNNGQPFNDEGSNTFSHLSFSKKDFAIPTLMECGIGNLTSINNTPAIKPMGSIGKMQERSVGKDTLTGHWEIMGLNVSSPFPSYLNGFPQDLIDELEKRSDHKFIGNCVASGTEIIKTLGMEQLKTGAIIIYTSTDSVLQLTANVSNIPLEELYRVCKIAREITLEKPEWLVGRIIARPYEGTDPTNFTRIPGRHDYAVDPSGKTILEAIYESGLKTVSIGKIADIFNHKGLTEEHTIKNNHEGMLEVFKQLESDYNGFCFTNLVDFDATYGHRRNAIGYAESVEEFDADLKQALTLLKEDDLLFITADHGNDPTWMGTDHTREYVPLICLGQHVKSSLLETRRTFSDLGATVADYLNVKNPANGTSFLKDILK